MADLHSDHELDLCGLRQFESAQSTLHLDQLGDGPRSAREEVSTPS
jgi:hypothetical protein